MAWGGSAAEQSTRVEAGGQLGKGAARRLAAARAGAWRGGCQWGAAARPSVHTLAGLQPAPRGEPSAQRRGRAGSLVTSLVGAGLHAVGKADGVGGGRHVGGGAGRDAAVAAARQRHRHAPRGRALLHNGQPIEQGGQVLAALACGGGKGGGGAGRQQRSAGGHRRAGREASPCWARRAGDGRRAAGGAAALTAPRSTSTEASQPTARAHLAGSRAGRAGRSRHSPPAHRPRGGAWSGCEQRRPRGPARRSRGGRSN